MTSYFVGFDVAQASDFSAISVIHTGIVSPYYRLRHLERLPRHTSYPEQVRQVVDLCDHIGRKYGSLPLLAVDFTGVGAPVFDMLRTSYHGVTKGVTITGGSQVSVSDDGRVHRIPKLSLVSRLRVGLESGHLKICREINEVDTLVDELGNFELRVSESGTVTMEAAGSGHDDLVLSLCIALWFAHEGGARYGDQQFVNPLIRTGRPPELHRAIPVWKTQKKPAFPIPFPTGEDFM
jgi:hypothetical protein